VIVDYLQLMQPRRQAATQTASRRCRRSRAGSRRCPRAERPGHRPLQLSRQPEMRSQRSRGCRISASPARSSRTPTSSASSGARRNAAQTTGPGRRGHQPEARQASQRATGEIQLYFKKKQTRFVSYAGERYAEAAEFRGDISGCRGGTTMADDGTASYSKPILTSTRYSTISPSRTSARRLHDLDGLDVPDRLRGRSPRPGGRRRSRIEGSSRPSPRMMMTPMSSVSSARVGTVGRPQSSPGIDEAGPSGRPS
jgi:hypothetical protein